MIQLKSEHDCEEVTNVPKVLTVRVCNHRHLLVVCRRF